MKLSPVLHSRTRLVLGSTSLVMAAAILAWAQHVSLQSARSTYATQRTRLVSMERDAKTLEQLRRAPQRATDRQLPHEQLAAEIEEAGKRASTPASALVSVWPEAPKRIQQSDYQEVITRLGFEQVDLQQIVAFVHHLLAIDPSLGLVEFRLTTRKGDGNRWDIELGIGYLLFAPAAHNNVRLP